MRAVLFIVCLFSLIVQGITDRGALQNSGFSAATHRSGKSHPFYFLSHHAGTVAPPALMPADAEGEDDNLQDATGTKSVIRCSHPPACPVSAFVRKYRTSGMAAPPAFSGQEKCILNRVLRI